MEDAIKIIEAAEEVLKIYHITKEIGSVKNIPEDQWKSLVENHPGSIKNRKKQTGGRK